MPLGTEVGLGPRDIVLDEDPAPPSPKGAQPPILGPRLLLLNGFMCQDTIWHEVGLSLGDIVLDGDPAPLPYRGTDPQFTANVRCGQTAGWTKMPLSIEVGLGPGDFVFDGNPALQKKAQLRPIFGPCLLWPNGWMDQDATWYGSKPQPRRRFVRRSCTPAPKGAQSTSFRFLYITAKRLDG